MGDGEFTIKKVLEPDAVDRRLLESYIYVLAEELGGKLRAERSLARSLRLELRYADEVTAHGQMRPAAPTSDDAILFDSAGMLFDRLFGRRVRVRGVSLSALSVEPEPLQFDLFPGAAGARRDEGAPGAVGARQAQGRHAFRGGAVVRQGARRETRRVIRIHINNGKERRDERARVRLPLHLDDDYGDGHGGQRYAADSRVRGVDVIVVFALAFVVIFAARSGQDAGGDEPHRGEAAEDRVPVEARDAVTEVDGPAVLDDSGREGRRSEDGGAPGGGAVQVLARTREGRDRAEGDGAVSEPLVGRAHVHARSAAGCRGDRRQGCRVSRCCGRAQDEYRV